MAAGDLKIVFKHDSFREKSRSAVNIRVSFLCLLRFALFFVQFTHTDIHYHLYYSESLWAIKEDLFEPFFLIPRIIQRLQIRQMERSRTTEDLG